MNPLKKKRKRKRTKSYVWNLRMNDFPPRDLRIIVYERQSTQARTLVRNVILFQSLLWISEPQFYKSSEKFCLQDSPLHKIQYD